MFGVHSYGSAQHITFLLQVDWYRVIPASHKFGLGQGLAEVSNGQIE